MERRIGICKWQLPADRCQYKICGNFRLQSLSSATAAHPLTISELKPAVSFPNQLAMRLVYYGGDMRSNWINGAKQKKVFPYVTGRWLQRQRGWCSKDGIDQPIPHCNTTLGAQRTCHWFCLFELQLRINKETSQPSPVENHRLQCSLFDKWLTRFWSGTEKQMYLHQYLTSHHPYWKMKVDDQ